MRVKQLTLIRGSQLLPFIKELRLRGVDPGMLLRDSLCPLSADLTDPDCFIHRSRLWGLVELASHTTGDRDFGWTTAMNHGLYGGGRFGYLLENQDSLRQAIALYAHGLSSHVNVATGAIEEEGDIVWLCRGATPEGEAGFHQVAHYTMGTMVHVIRCYLGSGWKAPLIKLAVAPPAGGKSELAGHCDEVIYHADRSAIAIPKSKLGETRKAIPHQLVDNGKAASPYPTDLFDIMVQMLWHYLPDYTLTLDNVSRIVELHPRVLNRRLATDGFSFRDVRDTVNINWAREQLAEGRLSMGEISLALGYANQSAFSRMVKRMTGASPSELRETARAI